MAVTTSPDGRRAASGSTDGSVRVGDLADYRQVWVRDDAGPTRSVAFSRDGHWLVSGAEDWIVRVWDAASGFGVARLYGSTNRVNSVAFGPDSRSIVSGGEDQNMRLWKIGAGGLVIMRSEDGASANALAWGPDNDHLVSITTGEVERLSPSVVKTPDGSPEDYRLALQRAETAVRLAQTQTATPTQTAQALNTLAFAQYRLGRYRDALDTVKRSAAIRPGDPYDIVWCR